MAINIPTFNLTANAQRRDFVTYVDVSDEGSLEPIWEAQGYGTEDSTVELSPDTESLIDILGIQHNKINSVERSQSVEPNTIRPIGDHGRLNPILLHYTRNDMLTHLSTFKVLYVYWFVNGVNADLYPRSSIVPSSIGGSSTTDFPYEIRPGGEVIHGTATRSTAGVVTFTPEE